MKKIIKILLFLILFIISIMLFFIGKGYNMYKEAINEIGVLEIAQKIREKDNYYYVSDLPQIYIDAVISVEDHRFYQHNGIDMVAISRALIKDLKYLKFVEGGSTITQQLAKNIYFTQEKRIERKIAELFMAFEIEKNLDKNEILELYLNTSYFGDGYYTVKEASLGYFKKEPKYMTDYECVMLAGIPNAPSVYSLTTNPSLAKQRQKQVLNKMVEYNYLTNDDVNRILNGGY